MKVDQKWRSTRPQKVRPPLPVLAKNAHMTRLSSKLFFLNFQLAGSQVLTSEWPYDGKNDWFSRWFWSSFWAFCQKWQKPRFLGAEMLHQLKFTIAVKKLNHACIERFLQYSGASATQWKQTRQGAEDSVRHMVCTTTAHTWLGPNLATTHGGRCLKTPKSRILVPDPYFQTTRPQTLPPPLPNLRNKGFFGKIEQETFFFKLSSARSYSNFGFRMTKMM